MALASQPVHVFFTDHRHKHTSAYRAYAWNSHGEAESSKHFIRHAWFLLFYFPLPQQWKKNAPKTSSKELEPIESVLSQSQGWNSLESFLKNGQSTSLSLGNNDETCRVTMKSSTPVVLNVSSGAWTDDESRSKGDFSFFLFKTLNIPRKIQSTLTNTCSSTPLASEICWNHLNPQFIYSSIKWKNHSEKFFFKQQA